MKGNGKIRYPYRSAPWFRVKNMRRERLRESRDRVGPMRSERERRFINAFARRILVVLMSMPPKLKRVPRTLIIEAARSAETEAGYRAPRESKINKNTANHLLRLARTQNALHEKLDAAGFTLENCAEIMASIAHDREQTASDRLRAVDMRVRLTVGYAPTRNASITATVTPDQFYDATFEGKPPPIAIEHDADPE